MKKLPYKGLFFIIFILLLILFSLVIFKTSYKTYNINGNCSKFHFRYIINYKYKSDYKINNTESEYILENNLITLKGRTFHINGADNTITYEDKQEKSFIKICLITPLSCDII